MNFNNLLKSFDTKDYFDALMKYGRIFTYQHEGYIFFFRQLTLAEIETVESVLQSNNMYLILEIEDWIVSNAVIYIDDGIPKDDNYVWDTDDLPSHLVSSLSFAIVSKSYKVNEEEIVYDIEERKQKSKTTLDMATIMAMQLHPIDKYKMTYDDLILMAAIKDMDYETSISERYEQAKQDAIKREAELKSKGVK